MSETIGLRAFGVLLWLAATAWIFALLRARHAVQLAVMLVSRDPLSSRCTCTHLCAQARPNRTLSHSHPRLQTIESERTMADIGKSKLWVLSAYNALMCSIGLAITAYGIVNIATASAPVITSDARTGATGYK